ncbi:MAG: rane fusion protein multidrug efflux system [Candidatus Binatota bacterium]|nr:rane fusion protein multidrug efflux system [Candidatus Binatota bacterium]
MRPLRALRVLSTAVAVGCAVAACGSRSDGEAGAAPGAASPAVPVTVVEAVRKDAPIDVRAIGTVEAHATVAVKPLVGGDLAEVHFTEGQEVRTGDLLFTIDRRPFEAALAEARANQVKAEVEARNAEDDARRIATLGNEGIVSREEYDRSQARAASARANRAAAAAAVAAAKLEVDHAVIRSPLDGRVGRRLVDPGNIVEANQTLLVVIHRTRPIFVRFTVPARELPRIRRQSAEQRLPVTVWSNGEAEDPLQGELTFLDNSVDAATGTVLLKALFANEGERLWPGEFVDVSLRVGLRRAVVLAPKRAILTGQQGRYAFVVRPDSTVEVRTVVEGETVGEDTVVEKGIEAGERVVVDGQLALKAGMRVEARAAAGAKTPAASAAKAGAEAAS